MLYEASLPLLSSVSFLVLEEEGRYVPVPQIWSDLSTMAGIRIMPSVWGPSGAVISATFLTSTSLDLLFFIVDDLMECVVVSVGITDSEQFSAGP
jgi:hypothetical protein